MKLLLLLAGFILASFLGLSAIAAPIGVSADTKYLALMPTAVQVDAVPVIGLSTPSAAQADGFTIVNHIYMPPVGGNSPSAMPGGASLGVPEALTSTLDKFINFKIGAAGVT